MALISGITESTPERRPVRLAGLVLVGLALGGCLYTPAEIESEPAPSRVYSTFPADGADQVGETVHLSITFHSAAGVGDVTLQVFPAPLSSGRPFIAGRTITWPDVVTGSDPAGRVLVIDAPTMRWPRQVQWYPGPVIEDHGRIAGRITWRGERNIARGTLVMAVPILESDSRRVDSIDSVASRAPAGAILAEPDDERGDTIYTLRFLEMDTEYYVVAILDTSGDGRYRTEDDSWGFYYADPALIGRIQARGWILDTRFPTPAWRTDVDIDLEFGGPHPAG